MLHEKKRVHYGWVVCLAGTVLLFVTMGTVSNGFSVYLPYILEAHGFSHSQTSFLVTLRCLVAFFAMLGIGFYYKKCSIRVGTALAALCAGVAFALYSAAETYPMYALGAAISGLSYGFGSMIPVSILMNRWFVRHRALALSICATGSGIATIVLPPVTTALVEGLGLKPAFRLEAGGILLLAILVFLLLRNEPAEKGLKACGWEEAHPTGDTEDTGPSYSLTPRLWGLLGCTSLLMGALANPGFTHLSVLYSEEGFSPLVVAGIISTLGVMLTVGKLLYGACTDRIGGCRASLLFGGLLLVGFVLCCLSPLESMVITVLTVLCMGIGFPIATIGPSVWAGDMTSPDRYPTAVRRLQVIYAGGALAFASVPGILADHFQDSYVPAYIMFSTFMLLALVCIALAYRK